MPRFDAGPSRPASGRLTQFGRSRAAGPVKAVRSMADPNVQTALEFAHHDHLRRRVPHREDFDASRTPAPESPVGAQHDRLRKAVPGHLNNGDTDHLMHDTGGLRTYAERPESPVGAHRDRLRKAAPELELPPRYYLDATDPSSPKGMYSGVGERPTRHSERSRGAGTARPATTSDRAGWIEADVSFKYQAPEEIKSKGRRMHSAAGAREKLKPEDHMAELMRSDLPEADASLANSATEAATGHAGEQAPPATLATEGGGWYHKGREVRGAGLDNLKEPDQGTISVLDSCHTDPQPGDDASRDLVVGQRILGQLVARKNKLRSVLPLMDSTCTGRIGFQDFSEGLRSAGVILGEADRRSIWSDAGGSLISRKGGRRGERMPAGEVDIASFVSRLEHSTDGDDWGKKKMREAGYSQHMQSSLTKGLVVRDDVEQFDPTGGGMHLRRGYASENSPPHDGAVPAPTAKRGVGAPQQRAASPMRWSKTEEHYRELIKQRKDALKQMFKAQAPGVEPGGAALSFHEFKGSMRTAGITLSDTDFEVLWRRVDSECLGLVKYEHVAKAFDLTDRRSVGEPGGSRALPHFREADAKGPHELPLERHAAHFASSLSAERIARAIVGGASAPGHTSCSINHEGGRQHFSASPTKPKAKAGAQSKVWDVVKETLAQHPKHVPLDADVLHRALTSAGAVVSKTDSAELWQRARQIAGKNHAKVHADAIPTVEDVQTAMNAAAQLQTPSKERALLSYGSWASRAAEAQAGGAEAAASESMLHGEAHAALQRLASGFLGNPHRLRQVFKKFDLDLQGSISSQEFERGLLDQWTSLSHDDVQRLSAAAQDHNGVVQYESFCKLVAAAPSGRGRAASPRQQQPRPDTDVISHRTHAQDVPVSYANQQVYASGSPRGGAGRGAQSPRGCGEEVARAARPPSVQRERSTGSVGSMRSRVSGLSAAGSLGGSGPSDRSSWMQDKAHQRRIVRSSSPAPSSSRAPGTPSCDLEHASHNKATPGTPRRPSSPCAARSMHFGGNEVANVLTGRDGAATRILHLTGGPPLATTVHRPRSISVVVG